MDMSIVLGKIKDAVAQGNECDIVVTLYDKAAARKFGVDLREMKKRNDALRKACSEAGLPAPRERLLRLKDYEKWLASRKMFDSSTNRAEYIGMQCNYRFGLHIGNDDASANHESIGFVVLGLNAGETVLEKGETKWD
jgi:hypothetical protein